ncbi:hypothetical protein [Streptomyces chrestomyceticus]
MIFGRPGSGLPAPLHALFHAPHCRKLLIPAATRDERLAEGCMRRNS